MDNPPMQMAGHAMMSKIEKTGDDERCLHEREGDVG